MSSVAVIAECNPIHLGHLALMERLRERGFDQIALFVSGNYVQRGEIALFDKWTRTKGMLLGADLVIEIPTPYVLSGATHFSMAGVSLAGALGGIDALAFGSETGQLEELETALSLLSKPSVKEKIAQGQREGKSYPRAIAEAVAGEDRKISPDFFSPNNILGLEYLKALHQLDLPITPITLRRFGHHDQGALSGLSLRQKILSGDWEGANPYLPAPALPFFAAAPTYDPALGEDAILTALKRMELSDFQKIPQVSEGLENALFTAARNVSSLSDFYAHMKSKRYPFARLRRIALAGFLNIQKEDLSSPIPPYLRILGLNSRGEELLHKASPSLPISTSLRRLADSNPRSLHFATIEARCTDLANLFTSTPSPAGKEWTAPPVKG